MNMIVKQLMKQKMLASQFNVYNFYKSQLKAYSKKQFDPFVEENALFYML